MPWDEILKNVVGGSIIAVNRPHSTKSCENPSISQKEPIESQKIPVNSTRIPLNPTLEIESKFHLLIMLFLQFKNDPSAKNTNQIPSSSRYCFLCIPVPKIYLQS